ncbi:glycoprotein hormone alpha-2 isoform X2 [Pseudophryne corroboree]|uniref:glycoprotein hormone alpha-2 isoform X2 n=1 Tax=Pseudophryne corroboree TaxID=495146 RepID=UPI0030813EA9
MCISSKSNMASNLESCSGKISEKTNQHVVEELRDSANCRNLDTNTMSPATASVFVILAVLILQTQSFDSLTPGCHLHPFNVTVRSDRRGTCRGTQVINACVGHCESSAFPSKYSVLVASGFKHNITSVSQCCTISKLQKVKVRLFCGASRWEEIEIGSALACQCDMCRLSRY